MSPAISRGARIASGPIAGLLISLGLAIPVQILGLPVLPQSARVRVTAHPGLSTYLADNSDWWSRLRTEETQVQIPEQKREPSPTNLRILGVDLAQNFHLTQAIARLGPVLAVQRGDAATGREQVCYVSEPGAGNVHLIFEEGEVEESFYLFEGGPPWKGESFCKPSKLVSASVRNDAGLGLGETRSQVESILGKPSQSRRDRLEYIFSVTKKTSAKDLAEWRKANPGMTEKEIEGNYGSYNLWIEVEVRFEGSKSSYVGILWSETD